MLKKSRDSFTAVARIIANPPPKWLPDYLEQFRAFVGIERLSEKERRWAKQLTEQMHHSIDHLIRWLPALAMYPGLGHLPNVAADVATATAALSRLKAELDRRPPQAGGRPPNTQAQWCAAVVVEAWKDIRRTVEPRSDEVLEACAAYWEVCGQPERDAGNWWRDTKHALANPNKVVQTLLNVHKTLV
jgi:hypothetical protein